MSGTGEEEGVGIAIGLAPSGDAGPENLKKGCLDRLVSVIGDHCGTLLLVLVSGMDSERERCGLYCEELAVREDLRAGPSVCLVIVTARSPGVISIDFDMYSLGPGRRGLEKAFGDGGPMLEA